MIRTAVVCVLLGASLGRPSFCQHKVAPQNMYYRVWAVVPIIGSGTKADPKRPLYAPNRADSAKMAARSGLIGFTSTLSDDGKFALVEFAATNPASLSFVLDDKRSDVKKFEKGKFTEEDVAKEFRKYKKNFDPRTFGAHLQ